MRCSNCGKDVPFIGNVCPYCHADKSKDQARETIIALYVGVPLIAGMFLVGFKAGLIMGGIGGVVALIVIIRKGLH